VAFVSPNAIDAAFAQLDRWPAGVALAVMGEGSLARLATYGLSDANATIFRPLDRERTDSETLLETLDLDALRGKRVLIVRGESGRELLGDRLREHGVAVSQVAAYRRTAPSWTEERRRQLLTLLDERNEWLITSSEALRIFDSLVRQVAQESPSEGGNPDFVAKMQQQRIVVPHVRIEETARSLGFLDVVRTGSGDERLLAALQFRP